MKWKTKLWSTISTAMMHLGAHNIFTQPTPCPSVREILFHPKATSHNTPGLPSLCILQVHAHVCHRTRIIQEGLGRALRVMKTLMWKAICNKWCWFTHTWSRYRGTNHCDNITRFRRSHFPLFKLPDHPTKVVSFVYFVVINIFNQPIVNKLNCVLR